MAEELKVIETVEEVNAEALEELSNGSGEPDALPDGDEEEEVKE